MNRVPNETGHQLPQRVVEAIVATLSADPRVWRVVLFGSRARGQAREGSDIDLCLEGKGLDLDAQLALAERLDELDLPWKIDLLVMDGIQDPALRERIVREGRVLFQRAGAAGSPQGGYS